MSSAARLFFLLLPVVAIASCDPGESAVDPRCEVLCVIAPPAIDGAGDICSQVSAEACIAECDARVADVPALCATCLLEEACFDCEDDSPAPVLCDPSGCVLSGREGDCTYPENDSAAYEDCQRQVNPLREVSCSADYRPVIECAALCENDEP